MKRRPWFALAAAALALAAGPVLAQSYPNKPIKLLVPFAPGGTTDIIARVIAEPLGRVLGQPVIVENKAGAGGALGALEVSRAIPDGYVLGMGTISANAANPAINPRIPYNPLTDFTPIINIAATPTVIAVHPGFPAKDYKGFIDEIKRAPGRYSYASSGTGGFAHLQMEIYKSLTGTFITHIPYRGEGPAVNDTVAGQVPIIYNNLPSAIQFIKDNRLVPIVVGAPERLPSLPNVPTFKEVGLEPVNGPGWYGLLGPKDMPRDLVDKLHSAVMKALQDPAVRRRIEDTGSLIIGNTPQQFAVQIKDAYVDYKKVVEHAKLKLD